MTSDAHLLPRIPSGTLREAESLLPEAATAQHDEYVVEVDAGESGRVCLRFARTPLGSPVSMVWRAVSASRVDRDVP
ncbi:hypothetical protein IMZ29_04265 [Achromobacter sp. GG226]|uniref:hypothetical protein n=1 Tax=Verticiella alkaliphila TaxID=2779529 RepID=UPI001C0C8050|nr:hypothetical protein [Verticiella sp. GG226]MBU4609786.1 hypothetical protein [Verticiella sp. GG226]